MAHKKGVGSSRNGRDSNPQMLGVKRFGGQFVTGGSILVRQRGTPFKPAPYGGLGAAAAPFARVDGLVRFAAGVESHFASIAPAGAWPGARLLQARVGGYVRRRDRYFRPAWR